MENATVETGATIERHAAVLNGSRVGRNAHVGENTIVMGRIGANAKIGHGSTILGEVGEGCTIGDGVRIPKGIRVPDGTTVANRCEIVWGAGNKPEMTGPGAAEYRAGTDEADPYMRRETREWDARDASQENEPLLVHPNAMIGGGSAVHTGATMEAGARVGSGVTVEGAYLGAQARVCGQNRIEDQALVNSTIGIGARVGAGATVEGPVGDGAEVGQGAILKPGTRVPDGGMLPANHVASIDLEGLPVAAVRIEKRPDPQPLKLRELGEADIGTRTPKPDPSGQWQTSEAFDEKKTAWIDHAEVQQMIEADRERQYNTAARAAEQRAADAPERGRSIEETTRNRKQPQPGGDPEVGAAPQRPGRAQTRHETRSPARKRKPGKSQRALREEGERQQPL